MPKISIKETLKSLERAGTLDHSEALSLFKVLQENCFIIRNEATFTSAIEDTYIKENLAEELASEPRLWRCLKNGAQEAFNYYVGKDEGEFAAKIKGLFHNVTGEGRQVGYAAGYDEDESEEDNDAGSDYESDSSYGSETFDSTSEPVIIGSSVVVTDRFYADE